MDKQQKVEFIESYIKIGNGDYQWNDNHGELIRCKDCKHGKPETEPFTKLPFVMCYNKGCHYQRDPEWFCADGEKKDG